MYKHNKKRCLEESKRPILWLKRKIILIITAFMIGMSNGMDEKDRTFKGYQINTEKQDKKD